VFLTCSDIVDDEVTPAAALGRGRQVKPLQVGDGGRFEGRLFNKPRVVAVSVSGMNPKAPRALANVDHVWPPGWLERLQRDWNGKSVLKTL